MRYALLTDLYELTMAYGYWKTGYIEKEAVFHLFFRRRPFQGTFAIAAGLESIIQMLQEFRFDDSDLAYLKTLVGIDGKPRIQGTWGAELVAGLDLVHIAALFRKGTDPSIDSYSAFYDNARKHSTGLAAYLKTRNVSHELFSKRD